MKLLVSEVFGPTVQGEGVSIGRPCMFLRLGGCSVQCEWCDTKYSWDPKNPGYDVRTMSEKEIIAALYFQGVNLPKMLVISGGEPMQQAPALDEMLPALRSMFQRIEIETSGVILPPISPNFANVSYNVSPKLAHAKTKRPYDLTVLARYRAYAAAFKFVVGEISDLEEVDFIVSKCGVNPEDVYIMPLGIGRHELMERTQRIVPEVVARGYNLTTRLHILIWGNTRGV